MPVFYYCTFKGKSGFSGLHADVAVEETVPRLELRELRVDLITLRQYFDVYFEINREANRSSVSETVLGLSCYLK